MLLQLTQVCLLQWCVCQPENTTYSCSISQPRRYYARQRFSQRN